MNNKKSPDIFDQSRVGYVLIESDRLDAWHQFAVDGIGMHQEYRDDDTLALRIDEHARRLIIRRGKSEDCAAIGIQLTSAKALQEVQHRLQRHGIDVRRGSDTDAALRGVSEFWFFMGPKGQQIDIFCDATLTESPLHMRASGFVTGDSGMGHVAITSRNPEQMVEFWQEIFDARVSDYIAQNIAGVMLDVTFLRLNERHHSVAIAATRGSRMDPIRTRIQHVNFLVRSMEDLSAAYTRLKNMGYEMAHEIGQHPNDKEVSFYVITPSGFELELGWNALTVNEISWTTTHYDRISLWGHGPGKPGLLGFLATNFGNLRRGLRSLLRNEYSPLQKNK